MAVRRFPVGAEVIPGGGTHFRLWAPRRRKAEVLVSDFGAGTDSGLFVAELYPEASGYFSGAVSEAGDGSLYRFRLDGEDTPYPDPASRFQPAGPHGPSQVVDPGVFPWSDSGWRGFRMKGRIIYELHLGTFTPEGSWAAAMRELQELADFGITVLEIMPIAEFPGRFGWGYDGVDLFAPSRLYGKPDDCRRFVDRAHGLGIGVILDVVYNHLGPDGNYLKQFALDYFTDRYPCDWGEAINFDGENSGPVREFFLSNAVYWIEEFHFDGLRLDATHAIFDSSREHIISAIGRHVGQKVKGRSTILIAEDESQGAIRFLSRGKGGYGLDAVWNDDFHHSAMVAMTGRNEAYFSDYLGKPQEFISAAKRGYLFQGQYCSWQKKARGSPTFGIQPYAFINYIQNHDQIANSHYGLRCHLLTDPGLYRAVSALLLLSPGTPCCSRARNLRHRLPFLYFADHHPELARLVARGRGEFLTKFRSLSLVKPAEENRPDDPLTFEKSKLDLSERERNWRVYQMHRDLLELRKHDPAFSMQREGAVDGAVLGEAAFVLRFLAEHGNDRLLIVNFGRDLYLTPAPEPLLAPPCGTFWETLWSSEDPKYGGSGFFPLAAAQNWRLQGHAAVVLKAKSQG